MDKLPTELIRLIFETGAADPQPVSSSDNDYPPPFPLLVASVCPAWREIALTTPSMWSHICIDRRFSLGYLRMWTDRSQPSPLHISIKSRVDSGVVELLGEHSRRWKSFSLVVLYAQEVYDFISAPPRAESLSSDPSAEQRPLSEYPILNHLNLRTKTSEPWSIASLNAVASSSRNIFSTQLPALRSLRIDGFCSQRCSELLRNLTSLEISYFAPTHAEMTSIASACPDLRTMVLPKFSCGSSPISQTDQNELPRIQLSSLKTFAVSFDWNHNGLPCRCLLPSFAMPNLTHLEISGDDYAPHLSTHFLISSTKSSFQKLETLRLHCLDLSVPGADLYHAFPSITSLELVDVGKLTALNLGFGCAEDLQVSNPILRPWPFLESIKLDATGIESLPWLIETVRQRREMGSPLSCIYITTRMFQIFSIVPPNSQDNFDVLRSQIEIDIMSLEETGLIELPDDDESEEYPDWATNYDDDGWGGTLSDFDDFQGDFDSEESELDEAW